MRRPPVNLVDLEAHAHDGAATIVLAVGRVGSVGRGDDDAVGELVHQLHARERRPGHESRRG